MPPARGRPPEAAARRAGLDRYGHLYPEADAALRSRLDAFYVAGEATPAGRVVELRR